VGLKQETKTKSLKGYVVKSAANDGFLMAVVVADRVSG
jgi:hypothetical protein